MTPHQSFARFPAARVLALSAAVAAASLVVHARSGTSPYLRQDDYVILQQSLDWTATRANLWEPVNEHCWPLFRLATYGVTAVAGSASALPLTCALAVRVALLLTLALLYLFVRRERGHAYFGLIAATVFGVTAAYQEAVHWYAASPALAAAGTTLLGLLAAQDWVRRGRPVSFILTAVWAAAAPGWYGGGILAGPLCGLYLWTAGRRRAAVVPVLGSLAFLVVALPQTGERVLRAGHHGAQTTVEAFDPVVGAVNTARAAVDNLALGGVGLYGVCCPPVVAAVAFAAVVVGVGWWWRRAPCRTLVTLGVGFVVLHGLLVYGARAAWPYEQIQSWSRYNVFPWLGVALGLAGGIGRSAVPQQAVRLTGRECGVVAAAIAGLLALNLYRGVNGTPLPESDQDDVLRRVDEVDARCQANGISADGARRVLAPLPTPGHRAFDAWRLLRGSDSPVSLSDDEARRALGD